MECVFVTVEEAARALGIGRSKAWELVKAGDLATVRIGRTRRVPVSAVHDYAARLLERAQRGTDAA